MVGVIASASAAGVVAAAATLRLALRSSMLLLTILHASRVVFHATCTISMISSSLGANASAFCQSPRFRSTYISSSRMVHDCAIFSAMAPAAGNSSMTGMGRRYVASRLAQTTEDGGGVAMDESKLEMLAGVGGGVLGTDPGGAPEVCRDERRGEDGRDGSGGGGEGSQSQRANRMRRGTDGGCDA